MFMLNFKDIRELRLAMGLKPTDFASKLGVADNTARRWELPPENRSSRYPSGENLAKLLEMREKFLAKAK
jgi:DNA-binding transcriptional regulator YiaG